MEHRDIRTLTTYQAGVIQAYMHRKLQKICDDILRPFGITKMQWLIIGTVLDSKQAGIRISDLSQKLGTTMSYLTNSVNLLESRGILERRDNDSDTRSKLVAVSSSFVPECEKIEAILRAGLRKTIYANVDPQEFMVYLKVMNELALVEFSQDS